jgi:hypothetical protein
MYGIVSGFTAAARMIIAAVAGWIIVEFPCAHTNTQNIKESTSHEHHRAGTPSGRHNCNPFSLFHQHTPAVSIIKLILFEFTTGDHNFTEMSRVK